MGVWDERRDDFKFEIVQISYPIGAALNEPNLVVESFHKSEGDLVIWPAVADDAVPMTFDQFDESLERFQSAPFELRLPVFKELPGPSGIVVIPQLAKRFF